MLSVLFRLLQAEEMFCLALKSDDQMFHIALYDWLICRNMSEKLLEVRIFLFFLILAFYTALCYFLCWPALNLS